MTKSKTLPTIPSELIRVALADLRLVEADPKYSVNMGDWHCPDDREDVCAVCLAGAVMAKTLEADAARVLMPSDFDSGPDRQALRALDHLRAGDIVDAFFCLSLPEIEAAKFCRPMADYDDDPEQFHDDMEELARNLSEGGY